MQNADKDLLNNFKAAALSITTLYRSSRHTSKRAYNAGYAAACQDLLMMIQQGVSVGDTGPSGSHDTEGGMTIGKVMDWIEARVDAIKSREEEEDEDEEKEKERETGRAASSVASKPQDAIKTTAPITPPTTTPKHKEQASSASLLTSTHASSNPRTSSQPPSPSPPPSNVARAIHHPPRPSKSRLNPTLSNLPPVSPSPNPTPASNPSTPTSAQPLAISTSTFPPTPMSDITVTAGAKRRHAVMMMLDSSSNPVSVSSLDGASHVPHNAHPHVHVHVGSNASSGPGCGSRRRTKSSRTGHQNQNLGDAMDVEEESGRERKRITRR